jgi:threonine dehydrogenase-like Zn-dependent dehydrogenase
MKAMQVEAEWAPRDGYRPTADEERTRVARSGCMVFRNPRFSVRDVPDPELGADEVLIRVRGCGICGSDVHIYERDADGYMLYPGMISVPVVTGHEFAGDVIAVGKDVADLRAGDPVCAEEIAWCGSCLACRSGYLNSCERIGELGFTFDGAHAELVVTKAKYCWPIGGLIDRLGQERGYLAGALVEPTSVSYIGMFVQSRGFMPGSSVAVVGAGPIGLAAVGLARAAGAGVVLAFEPSATRRRLAEELGADAAYDPLALRAEGRTIAEVAREHNGGRGLDLWVEASGAPGVVAEMTGALAANADVVLLGRGTHRLDLDPERLIVSGAALSGSIGHSGSGAFGRVISLMAAGRLDMSRIVTETVPLDEATTWLGRLSDRESGKVVVVP